MQQASLASWPYDPLPIEYPVLKALSGQTKERFDACIAELVASGMISEISHDVFKIIRQMDKGSFIRSLGGASASSSFAYVISKFIQKKCYIVISRIFILIQDQIKKNDPYQVLHFSNIVVNILNAIDIDNLDEETCRSYLDTVSFLALQLQSYPFQVVQLSDLLRKADKIAVDRNEIRYIMQCRLLLINLNIKEQNNEYSYFYNIKELIDKIDEKDAKTSIIILNIKIVLSFIHGKYEDIISFYDEIQDHINKSNITYLENAVYQKYCFDYVVLSMALLGEYSKAAALAERGIKLFNTMSPSYAEYLKCCIVYSDMLQRNYRVVKQKCESFFENKENLYELSYAYIWMKRLYAYYFYSSWRT